MYHRFHFPSSLSHVSWPLLWLSLIAVPACIKHADMTLDIIGGDKVEDPASSLAAAPVIYSRGCSYVLLSPFQLLTAGHCVERYPSSQGYSRQVEKGNEIEIVAFDGKSFNGGRRKFLAKVRDAVVHPSWHQKLNQVFDAAKTAVDAEVLDLALVTLDGNLPKAAASLNAAELDSHQSVLLVGTGCMARDGGTLGDFLQTAPLSIQSSTKLKFEVGTQRRDHPEAKAGVCEGDSGGGTFKLNNRIEPELGADRKWQLIGISSYFGAAKNQEEFLAPIPLVAIRVDSALASTWIAAQMHATPPLGALQDTQPQTYFEAIDRIRTMEANDEYRIRNLLEVIQGTPELKLKLSPEEVNHLAQLLNDANHRQEKSDALIRKFLGHQEGNRSHRERH